MSTTRFERIVGPTEPDPPKAGEMPPWVRDYSKNPCPYRAIVKRLEQRMFGESNQGTHEVWYKLSEGYGDRETFVRRDEFIVKRYGCLGITGISVVVPNVGPQIEIYSTSYEGGWRHGPWWPRFEKLVKKWCKEADEHGAERERKKREEEEAERQKQNGLFQAYLKGTAE